KLPHIEVDVPNKRVRVECKSCKPDYGLEFFLWKAETNEYESVLATEARASHIHLALLMIGLEPGEPAHYSESAKKWIPPNGPPLKLSCEYEKNGKTVRVPSYRMLRSHKEKKYAPPFTWLFAGSRVMEDGVYAADTTGCIVGMLNSDLAVMTLSDLASTALEDRDWEPDPKTVPDAGTKVWMVIEPVVAPAGAPKPGANGNDPAGAPQR